MAQHFNSAGHSITDVQVRGMRLSRGSNILRKQLEMRLIFRLGTVQPDGLSINFKYSLRVRTFNVVTNILRILTVIFHTEEGLYTRNVCVKTILTRLNNYFLNYQLNLLLV